MSFAPLSTRSWQEAVEAVLAGKVMVLAEYDVVARAQTIAIRLPSVIATKCYVDMARPAPFTRLNCYLAYRFRCCFCGVRHTAAELTFDHLIPRARGGVTSWLNCLPACMPCNQRKGCRTPKEAKMPLQFRPRRPTVAEINALAASDRQRVLDLHRSWRDFLYWDCDVGAPA
jgi:5-methylcytosine-specific restriction endonuclease McrA